jgi:CHAT domain-containing protein
MKKLFALLLLWGFVSLNAMAQDINKLQIEFDSLNKLPLKRKESAIIGKKLIDLHDKKPNIDSLVLGKILIKTAFLNSRIGKMDSVVYLATRAVKTIPENNEDHIYALHFLGTFSLDASNYVYADSLILVSAQKSEKYFGKSSDWYFKSLYYQGKSKFIQSNYEAAQKKFEEGIALWGQLKKPEGIILANFYADLGNIVLVYGQNAKAEEMMRSAIRINEKSTPNARPNYLQFTSLIRLYLSTGSLAEALKTLEVLSEDMITHSEHTGPQYAELIHQKGFILAEMHLFDESIVELQKSLTLFKACGRTKTRLYIGTSIDLANDLYAAKEYKKSSELLGALRDSIKIFGFDKILNNISLLSLSGKCANEQNDTTGAIAFFEKANMLYEENFEVEDVLNDYKIFLNGEYATVLLKMGKYDEARKKLAQIALAIKDQNINRFETRELLNLLTIIEFTDKKSKIAYSYSQDLTASICESISKELFLLTEYQRLQRINETRDNADFMLTFLKKEGKNLDGLAANTLNFQLFSKSLLLSAAQNIRQNIQSDPTLAPVFANYNNTRERLAWCYTQPKSELETQKINIGKLEFQADSLEKIIARQSTTFAAANLNKSFKWTEVRDRLHTGEAALEIVRYHEVNIEITDSIRYAIFVITPEMKVQPAVIFLPNGEEIETILTEKYLTECANRAGKGNTQGIYSQLWKPLEPFLKNINRVYVSADGAFHKINLGALKKANGTFLADNIEIKPIFSLKDLATADSGQRTGNGRRETINGVVSVLVGNPRFSLSTAIAGNTRSLTEIDTLGTVSVLDAMPIMLRNLDESRGLSLNPLPGSQKEVEEINALLQKNGLKTTLLTQENATETALKAIKKPKIMHLATHGYFLANSRNGTAGLSRGVVERNPMLRSMLFFAGAQATLDKKNNPKSEGDDGILTAYEAQNMDLEGTELVVLSACQTAQGKLQNGEGVYGLQRALRIAGAQNIILSLWDVDDTVGRLFMRTFYEKWLGGMSKSDAFRFAQLEIKKAYPQPFYWAGFVLVGE